ncbi:MAG TPA: Rrf2 family transcriptional regulator [Candidatus Binatia bacterium]|nr:Rrf2 family transcriptional regulator [Candidatus Binatia bacterium]
MKVSSKGHYGLLALAELASTYRTQRALQLKEIAESQGIPEQYLGQIMALLKRGELVHGVRGPTGGYTLARPPERISVKEVLQVLEGPIVPFDLSARRGGQPLPAVTRRLNETWSKGLRAMETVLDETTLADLCRTEAPPLMYYI